MTRSERLQIKKNFEETLGVLTDLRESKISAAAKMKQRAETLARQDERARVKRALPRAVSKQVRALVRGPFSGETVAVAWRYSDVVAESTAPYAHTLADPVMIRAVASFAEARLSEKDLREFGASGRAGRGGRAERDGRVVDFEYRRDYVLERDTAEPKFPIATHLRLPKEIVFVVDVMVRKYTQLSRSMILSSALLELARAEHPAPVRSPEEEESAAWEKNERALAKDYRGVAPEDMEKEWEEAEAMLAAKYKTGDRLPPLNVKKALEKTAQGAKIDRMFGISDGCAGLTVIDDPEAEGGKGIGVCAKPTLHLCPDCRQRFCDACYSVTESDQEGECPTCDET